MLAICPASWLPADDSTGDVFFESKIRPLLLSRCIECHGDTDPDGELSLTSREGLLKGGTLGPALVPGKPKESLVISAIHHDAFLKMPPKDKLPTSDLALMAKWVAMGAPWPNSTAVKRSSEVLPSDATTVESAEKREEQVAFTEEQKTFWAYQPMRRPVPPDSIDDDWSRSPIDRFLFAKLRANGLTPAKPASKRDLIRRVTYDLTGLPPSVDEIESFLSDASPDAFARVVDRLLASPRYGEKWGRHWLDVARFADSNGLDENIAYANAFRYRDYVITSLNRDTPYDRFVQEQIAGDLLALESSQPADADPSFDRYAATGFLAIGAKMLAEDDPVKMQMDIIDEQLSTVCQAFMGMTIGCARCHDHKFDPIPTADYYALAGIFKSTKTMENHRVVAKWFERPLAPESDLELMRKIDVEIAATEALIAQANDRCRARVAKDIRSSIADALIAVLRKGESKGSEDPDKTVASESASQSPSKPNPVIDSQVLALWRTYFSNTRKRLAKDPNATAFFAPWLSALDLQGKDNAWQQIYLELESETPLRNQTPPRVREAIRASNPQSMPELAKLLASLAQQVLSDEGNVPAESIKLKEELLSDASPLAGPKSEIAKFYSEDEKATAATLGADLAAIKSRRPNPPMAMGVTEAQPEDLKIHLRGSHLVFGKLAKRRFPQILASTQAKPIEESSSGRLELAQWMTRPEHPLTSRMIVNRVWHWHFKRGIVPTVDNFGMLGQKPTHPELLDWLANDLIAHGWSIKHLHRTILLSQTYQMGSQIASKATEIDPDNELRWQFQRRRLTAEETRDSILEVGAGLETTMYGTLMKVPNHTYVNSTGAGGVLNYSRPRRSIYLPVIRSGMFEVLQTLDFPDPAMSSGERQTSTAAPQALLMMNSDLVHEQSLAIAQQLVQTSMDDRHRIQIAYRRILKRQATEEEWVAATQFVRSSRDHAAAVATPITANATSPEEQRELLLWQGLCRVLISSNEFSYIE